jgi:hypothetical protein
MAKGTRRSSLFKMKKDARIRLTLKKKKLALKRAKRNHLRVQARMLKA